MHDVGKTGIPENILQKTGRLTDAEFNVTKTHPNICKDILGSSDRELLNIACIISHQHHEQWDGVFFEHIGEARAIRTRYRQKQTT